MWFKHRHPHSSGQRSTEPKRPLESRSIGEPARECTSTLSPHCPLQFSTPLVSSSQISPQGQPSHIRYRIASRAIQIFLTSRSQERNCAIAFQDYLDTKSSHKCSWLLHSCQKSAGIVAPFSKNLVMHARGVEGDLCRDGIRWRSTDKGL